MYPDFIGIGAQKAGTTWLSKNLRLHPQIHMPRKEVHYFDRKINDRSNAATRLFGHSQADAQWRRHLKHWLKTHTIKKPSLRALLWGVKYYMRPYDDRWYASVFEPKKGKISGEITPAYSMLDRDRISHVHRLMPHAKILFMMRNPIERAWSQVVMRFDRSKRGDAAWAGEERLIKSFESEGLRLRTDYRRTLENWGTFYPEEQIFVGFLEDIHFFPEEFLRRVHEFLGVDTSFTPPQVRRRVHSRSAGTMPAKAAVHLAHVYREQAARLDERFGGYASFWHYCAERLVEDPPDDENVPYPLWESSLWEEWTGATGLDDSPRLQSAPLSSA